MAVVVWLLAGCLAELGVAQAPDDGEEGDLGERAMGTTYHVACRVDHCR